MKYSILQANKDVQYCAITKRPEGMRNPARPTNGTIMGGTYKKPLDLHMSAAVNPQGIQVADVVLNAVNWLVVSQRMKALLEEVSHEEIEFLPFRLIDHKGRALPEPVFVANVLGTVDCGDRARSKGTDSPFEKGRLIDCRQLAIDERKVPKDKRLFRVDLFPQLVLVRDDLRGIMEERGMIACFVAPGTPL